MAKSLIYTVKFHCVSSGVNFMGYYDQGQIPLIPRVGDRMRDEAFGRFNKYRIVKDVTYEYGKEVIVVNVALTEDGT